MPEPGCIRHPRSAVVATCASCQGGMCTRCWRYAEKYRPICVTCQAKRNEKAPKVSAAMAAGILLVALAALLEWGSRSALALVVWLTIAGVAAGILWSALLRWRDAWKDHPQTEPSAVPVADPSPEQETVIDPPELGADPYRGAPTIRREPVGRT